MTLLSSEPKTGMPACFYISRYAPERSPTDPFAGLPRFLSEHCRLTAVLGPSRRKILFAAECDRLISIDSAMRGAVRAAFKTVAACRSVKPDFIICCVDELSLILGWLASRCSSRPYWVVVENPPFTARYGENPGLARRIERGLRTWLLRRLIGRSKGLLCFTERRAVEEFLVSGARLVQLKIGVSDTAYERLRASGANPSKSDERRPYTVGYVGAIDAEQGILELLEATAMAREAISDIRVVLVGEVDPQWQAEFAVALEKFDLTRNVEVTGWLLYEEMLKRLADCDVCCYTRRPSDWSLAAHPLKICEYLGSARAIVAWDYPGCRTVLRDGRFGMLVPPGNTALFAKMLVRLAEPEARTALESEIRNNIGELLTRNSYRQVIAECAAHDQGWAGVAAVRRGRPYARSRDASGAREDAVR